MGEVSVVKKEQFNEILCEFMENEKEEILMTSDQLGQALGYLNPRVSIANLVKRNPYLKNKEFSGVIDLISPSGKQKTRVFNEDGIYEVTLLANTDTALRFRYWVRKVLKDIRRNKKLTSLGLEEIIPNLETEIQGLVQALQLTDGKVLELEEKVEERMTIDYGKQMRIQFQVRKRVVGLLGGKTTLAYSKQRYKFFGLIYSDIKKEMEVGSYRDILMKDYERAISYIQSWHPKEEIVLPVGEMTESFHGIEL